LPAVGAACVEDGTGTEDAGRASTARHGDLARLVREVTARPPADAEVAVDDCGRAESTMKKGGACKSDGLMTNPSAASDVTVPVCASHSGRSTIVTTSRASRLAATDRPSNAVLNA
jgi:hypothetical protein